MKFEEALEHFKNEIAMEYGLDRAIIKIGIEPDLMDRIAFDMYSKTPYQSRFTLSQFGEFVLNGVQLLPRRRDSF